ncbi:hypothetical protein B0H63DRAFT_294900 [Podospora didyma]|uniref:UAS domain-containing protein n=1 Tax=Podospora didyma TaxID=330526 RepID=A0AAE0N6B3_9PEZI|nr:hypothetical protein B0H63DRAFT_294900 [Podospora didyma]
MATEADFDLNQLEPSQQETLQQFMEVTGQEMQDAVPLLQRSRWDIQTAISRFFGDEERDPEIQRLLAEADAAQGYMPRPEARLENLQESLYAADSVPLRAARPTTDPAPRVVPPPPVTYRLPFLLTVIFAPFRLGYALLRGVWGILSYPLSFLPQSLWPFAVNSSIRMGLRGTSSARRVVLPKETAERFRREFEEEYGAHGLTFFEGGHAQALDAAKRDLNFLLIVLISPEHDDTSSFVRDTLLAPEVVAFISNPAHNIILWGGNVLDPEAYQVATEYMCNKYPFSCLACLTPKEGSSRMGIVKRLIGPMEPDTYIAGLHSAISKYSPDLDGVRAERAAQAVARNLRSEQDSAYERSLALDQERSRKKREAAAAAAAAEKKALEAAQAAARQEELRQQWRKWRAAKVPAQPAAGVRIALHMPLSAGGHRVMRFFAAESTLEDIYAFVECYDLLQEDVVDEKKDKPESYEHKYRFQISNFVPREKLEPSTTTTLGEAIGRGGNLIAEDLDDEDVD